MILAGKRRQVLLATEGRAYAEETGQALRRINQCISVVPLPDAQSCLDHLGRCGTSFPVPDLLLLDMVMPGGPDGLAILTIVRRMETLAHVPVLMVGSSAPAPEHHEEARRAGASAVLVKPVEKSQYPEFARQIFAWLMQNSWSEVGPERTLNSLASHARPLESALAMPADALTGSSPLDQFERIKDWFVEVAERGLDPFQRALSDACRRHHLRPVQMLKRGGSLQLISNRREVLVDLIAEGWPPETLQEVCPLSGTEIKRLRKLALDRGKDGPRLDRGSK